MILNNITYNDIQKIQDIFFKYVIKFINLPVKKRLGILPFMLVNQPYYTSVKEIENSNTNYNISELGNFNEEIKLLNNKDEYIINNRNIYNIRNNRLYQTLFSSNNKVTFQSQPEERMRLEKEDYLRDSLLFQYDYQKEWEHIIPNIKNICLPQQLNYYKQELQTNTTGINFNSLYVDIDYNLDFLSTNQTEIQDEDSTILNILVKKPFLIELYEVKMYNSINSILNLLDFSVLNMDTFNYQYVLKTILQYCFAFNDGRSFNNLKLKQSAVLKTNTATIQLKDEKVIVTVSIKENNTTVANKKLVHISDGFNIIFVSNYKYALSTTPINFILYDKVIQEINGGLRS